MIHSIGLDNYKYYRRRKQKIHLKAPTFGGRDIIFWQLNQSCRAARSSSLGKEASQVFTCLWMGTHTMLVRK